MNSSLCRLNAQIDRNSLCLIFDDLIISHYIFAILAVKKGKNEMSFKSSIKPSCPISEIATSHVCRLKNLERRVIKMKCFSNQESGSTMSYSNFSCLQAKKPRKKSDQK